ncbi:MAG: PAS domain-containing protein [Ilumatobacteraceae bacterium]
MGTLAASETHRQHVATMPSVCSTRSSATHGTQWSRQRHGRVRHSRRLVLGFDSSAVVGDSVFDFLHPDDLETAADRFVRRLEFDGADQGKEVRLRNSSGDWTAVVATASLVPDPGFGTCAITLTAADAGGSATLELALRRRIVVAEYINRLGADLMATPDAADVVARIGDALREIALLSGADSATVYIERREREVVELLAEWRSSTLPDSIAIDIQGSDAPSRTCSPGTLRSTIWPTCRPTIAITT